MLKPDKPERPRQGRHEHNKGHKHGKKGKKDKEGKNKHKYQHEDFSEEENKNEVTQAPMQLTNPAIQPEMSHSQEMSPNTDIVPRCPGRVWEPISLIPSTPTVKPFSIDDLMLAAVDLTPTSDQDIKNDAPLNPKQNDLFNDEDLLS